MSLRKGQFSIYLKPILVVILSILLIALLVSNLRFGGKTQEERIEYELDVQAPKIKNNIINCLALSENSSAGNIIINGSKLKEWNREYKYSEPSCAEDYQFGWNTTIELQYISTSYIKPIAYINGSKDSVEPYLETKRYDYERIGWKNVTGGDLNEFRALIIGSPQNLSKASDFGKAEEEIEKFVEDGGTLVTTGDSWKTIDQVWPEELKKEGEDSGVFCVNATKQGKDRLGVSYKEHSTWLESETDIVENTTDQVEVLMEFKNSCSIGPGSDSCSSSPSGRESSPAALGFEFENGYVMNTVTPLGEQGGCSIEYASLFRGLKGFKTHKTDTGGVSSCTVKPREVYRRMDIAFVLDPTTDGPEGYDSDAGGFGTPEVCNVVENNIIGQLKAAGIDLKSKIYQMPEGPTLPEWKSGRGSEVSYKDALDDPHWSYGTPSDYSCKDEKSKWPDNIAFHPMKDSKAEGWGASSTWIAEDFNWRPDAMKIILVVGNQDPTGGCSGSCFDCDPSDPSSGGCRVKDTCGCNSGGCEPYSGSSSASSENYKKYEEGITLGGGSSEEKTNTAELDTNCENDFHCNQGIPWFFTNPWRKHPGKKCKGSTGGELDSEVEVMNNLIEKTKSKDISVVFLRKREYKLKDQYGDPDEYDFLEAMEKVAEETEGKVFKWTKANDLVDYLKDKIGKIQISRGVEPCENVNFNFGEGGFKLKDIEKEVRSGGSMGASLDGRKIYNFPVQVMQSSGVKVPAQMKIEVRKGDLETLSGAINRVYKIGKKRREDFEDTLSITLDSKVVLGNVEFTKLKEKTYTLSGGPDPSDDISVDDDLKVGVNGVVKFEDQDSLPTSSPDASYKGSPIAFKGSLGDSFQVIARNINHPSLGIGELYLHCCGGKKQKLTSGISSSEGSGDYMDLHPIFYHNFTEIKIGEKEEYEEKGICINAKGKRSCVNLKAENVNSLELSPGHYYLKIKYDSSENSVEVIK